jgi:hypothetical protein
MVYYQTKNPNFVKFWKVWQWKMLVFFYGQFVYFTAKWYILWPFGTFCGHLVHFEVIWYILWSFGTFCGHLVHFVVIWYILWSFGTFCGHLVYFFPVLVFCTEKNLATLALTVRL